MARKARWLSVFLVLGGLLVLAYSQSEELTHLIGLLLVASGIFAFIVSFLVRWESLASSEVPRAEPLVLCPRGGQCFFGGDGTTTICERKETLHGIPEWARGSIDPDILLGVERDFLAPLDVEYVVYECPACASRVLYLVRHGDRLKGRLQLAVKLGPGIHE